ncbi:MAG: carboxypeptidase regulatory-like domain-containing protein [Janthinobacterium lividum]
MPKKRSALLSVACVLAGNGVLRAQLTTTNVVGHITDTSGASLPQAQVTVVDDDRNQTHVVTADAHGEFRVEFLEAGHYHVEVTAPGFKKYIQNGLTLYVGLPVTVDAQLAAGDVNESVEVIAGDPVVNTTSFELGTTIESGQITELPLVDRNAYTLLDITPGVQSNQNSIVLGYPEQRTRINGGIDAGTGSVNYYLDGSTNITGLRNTGNILPNPDALQEFRVQTSGYGADQGRFASGVINVITRSGTNQLHGTLFEFFRNDALKAQDWGSGGLPNSPLNRNQFGATAGGPIRKDRTFFFGSYAGLRQDSSTFLTGAVVPTAAERTGDFSADAVSSFPIDPTTKTFFTCGGVIGKICANRLDPVAQTIVNNYVPLANSGSNLWKGYVPVQYISDEFLGKIDHVLNPKQRLLVEYFNTSGNSSQVSGSTTTLPWSQIFYHWRQQNAIVSHTWVLSPSVVNQVWATYTRNFAGRVNTPQTSLADLGSTFTPSGPAALPSISVTGYFVLGESLAGPEAGSNFYALRDLVSLTKGRHSIRAGGEFLLDKDIQIATQASYGAFSFTSSLTAGSTPAPGTKSPTVKYAGNALASFMIGSPQSVTQASPTYGFTNSFNTALFLQDDYRVTPRLTLNLGLRWDVQTPPTDPQNKETTYIPGRQSTVYPSAPVGQLFPGDMGVTRGVVPVRYTHVSPRIGFAFDPTGQGKTAFRGGVGIYFGSVAGNEWNVVQNYQPFALSYTFPNAGVITGATLSNPYRTNTTGNIVNPFPFTTGFVTGATAAGISTAFQWPYTYQLNFSVQQQLTRDLGVTIAYVGSLGHNLPFGPDVNAPQPSATATSAAANVLSRRPNPKYGTVYLLGSNQTAEYNALQVQAIQRMSHTLSLNAYYVWSKTIDSVDLGQTVSLSGAQDYNNLKAERGRASDDLRHTAAAAIVWDPMPYHGDSRLVGGTVNHWQISTIAKIRSGTPFTILNGADANLDGSSAYDRAQVVGDYHLANRSVGRWFNTAAFAQNPVTAGVAVDGNSPRNLINGPFYKDVDLSLQRDFPLFEKTSLRFRGDATNVFNIISYDAPGSAQRTVSSTTFGQITTAEQTRILQLGVKLLF